MSLVDRLGVYVHAFQIQIVPVRDIPEKTLWYICPILLIVAYQYIQNLSTSRLESFNTNRQNALESFQLLQNRVLIGRGIYSGRAIDFAVSELFQKVFELK